MTKSFKNKKKNHSFISNKKNTWHDLAFLYIKIKEK
jgi:hypothetical protein